MGQKDMINREQRSVEPRRERSCFDYLKKCLVLSFLSARDRFASTARGAEEGKE
jgi:hypothetical protein